MTDHVYGDEPECALCGHIGPDTDPQPCVSRLEAGRLVHGLKRRVDELMSTTAVTATALAMTQHQLHVMHLALEFYADDEHYDADDAHIGATAEQALRDVFGDNSNNTKKGDHGS